jgi:hypothetical protein
MEQYESGGGENGGLSREAGNGCQAVRESQRLPLTFAEAETHNPFALLVELHDHAMALRVEEKPAGFHLTELALSAAVVAWWSRWMPVAMHRAFVAGAGLDDVAAATGCSEAEAYERRNAWASTQSGLVIGGRVGVDAGEVAGIRGRWGPTE